jgi:tetratricopeptide (TPR) repeat protein
MWLAAGAGLRIKGSRSMNLDLPAALNRSSSEEEERVERRRDWGWAWGCAGAALLLYAYTLAPSVTLEDSGELVTAASRMGVPHPPGYPLWTLCGFIFSHLVPLHNWAWRINLMSAVLGAATILIFAALCRRTVRILLRDEPEGVRYATCAALAASGILACSDVMWSQSVIAEVYTLNALCLVAILWCFHEWTLDRTRLGWLTGGAFFLALGMTNHHTLLFVAPALLVGVYLARRSLVLDFVMASALTSGWVLVAFCALSRDVQLAEAAFRISAGLVLVLLSVAAVRAFRLRWGWMLSVFGAVWVGLSVYAYMPLASATNPPMNWGYARTLGGFFHAINRGQYSDSMSALLRKWVVPAVGVPVLPPNISGDGGEGAVGGARLIVQLTQYALSLYDNISPLIVLVTVAAIPLIWSRRKRHPAWLGFLAAAFLCLSTIQIAIMNPGLDNGARWTGRTFFLQSHVVFSVWVSCALGLGLSFVARTVTTWCPAWAWGLLVLPIFPLALNWNNCSQRGHWFGWQYGYDMLVSLERNAVLYGGTDPGRFIPTYMIFCESFLPQRWKREPSFDRSDLYIITQNALSDGTYQQYIRDHYGADRPPVHAVERQLGRDKQYPVVPLILPDRPTFEELLKSCTEKAQKNQVPVDLNKEVARWIFERNRGQHTFYVEESFQMEWSYPYAVPDKLLMRLEREPLKALPVDAVRAAREFWDRYAARLMAHPRFVDDRPARQGFAKLRLSQGNLLAWREWVGEAEYAYRQALQLDPDNVEVCFALGKLLASQKRYSEAENSLAATLSRDPLNESLIKAHDGMVRLVALAQTRWDIEEMHRHQELNPSQHLELAMTVYGMEGAAGAMPVLKEIARRRDLGPSDYKLFVGVLAQMSDREILPDIMMRWSDAEPKDDHLAFDTAGLLADVHSPEVWKYLKRALTLNPALYQPISEDPLFESLKKDPRWNALER